MVSLDLYCHLEVSLTAVAWGLQAVLGEGAPADRKDVPGVVLAPVVKSASPPIEHDEDFIALNLSDCCRADKIRVLLVHRLQLHARFEAVLGGSWRFLKDTGEFSLHQLTVQTLLNVSHSFWPEGFSKQYVPF